LACVVIDQGVVVAWVWWAIGDTVNSSRAKFSVERMPGYAMLAAIGY